MRFFNARMLLAALILVTTSLVASNAAAENWVLFQIENRQFSEGDAATFRDLLQSELTKRNGVTVSRVDMICGDVKCVTQNSPQGADVGVTGTLSALGSAVFVTVTAYDLSTQTTKSSQQMKVDRVEELDKVAARVAEAFASYENTDDTAQLGTVTTEEAKPDTRRDADGGFILGMGALIPIDGYTGDSENVGIGIDLGYWYESRKFAIHPRVGFRFNADTDEEFQNSYFEVPIDVGVFWIPGLGDFSPLLGGGAGVRYINEDREVIRQVGTVIQTSNQTVLEDDGWGFSMYGRAGVLMLRTYSMRISITGEYSITFLKLNDDGFQQAVLAGVNVVF